MTGLPPHRLLRRLKRLRLLFPLRLTSNGANAPAPRRGFASIEAVGRTACLYTTPYFLLTKFAYARCVASTCGQALCLGKRYPLGQWGEPPQRTDKPHPGQLRATSYLLPLTSYLQTSFPDDKLRTVKDFLQLLDLMNPPYPLWEYEQNPDIVLSAAWLVPFFLLLKVIPFVRQN